MSAIEYIREYYKVDAYRGRRIRFGKEKPVEGTILGGKGALLRVRLNGLKRTALLHPTWEIEYL